MERDELDRLAALERQAASAERSLTDHARTQSAFTEELRRHGELLADITTDRAVRTERDTNLNSRLDRIEKSINGVYNLGKWVLAAFGSALIVALATFLLRGGLNIGP
jgi:septal ring factor EnvC (AmiA/AmiB activator)